MEITTRVPLTLGNLREGVSLRDMAPILGIPTTTLRGDTNPILAPFECLEPVLPDGESNLL